MSDLKMPDINSVLIAANVTSEPVYRKTSKGTPVLNFNIASNRKYKDNSGIWRESLCQVGVIAWHKLAEIGVKTLKIGSTILVDGELQSKSWRTDDGTTRSIVEIRARRIQLLEHQALQNIEEQTDEIEASASEQHNQSDKDDEESSKKSHYVEPTDFDFGYQNLKL